MYPPRIFQASKLTPHTSIDLEDRAKHYLTHVLRIKNGDPLTLFNGQGGEFSAHIQAITKKTISVQVEDFIDKNRESPLDLHLVQGVARGEKMDFIIQKAVELGVKKITPLLTERSHIKLSSEREEKRMLHWQGIIISACEQCGRNFLPELERPILLREWIPMISGKFGFVLLPSAHQKLIQVKEKPKEVSLLIGPEGGFSDEEENLVLSNGFQALNLGPRVLRTETASVAALSIIQSKLGDM